MRSLSLLDRDAHSGLVVSLPLNLNRITVRVQRWYKIKYKINLIFSLARNMKNIFILCLDLITIMCGVPDRSYKGFDHVMIIAKR